MRMGEWISTEIQMESERERNGQGDRGHSLPYKPCQPSRLSSQITTKTNGCVVILVTQSWYVFVLLCASECASVKLCICLT